MIESADEIKALLERDDINGALELLLLATKGKHNNLYDDVLLLSGQYNSVVRDKNRGFIGALDYFQVVKGIQESILNVCESVFTKKKDKKTILFLGASPKDLDVLRTGEEIQRIKDGLSSATYRNYFEFIIEPAVQVSTITKAIQKHTPEIVHFSGHGAGAEGLSVENEVGEEEVFPTAGLDRLFKISADHVQCVVFNACYASAQAEVISRHGIYVVGMSDAISDTASIHFSAGFYQSLGEGQSYEKAFDIGMIHISPYIEDAHVPELWKDGVIVKN